MSTPKVGDRVRVVIEGEVDLVDDDGWGRILGDRTMFIEGMGGVVSIEVIAPPFVLPKKRWAQVVDGEDTLWTRAFLEYNDDGSPEWCSLLGTRASSDWLIIQQGLRVISEGVSDE